MAKSDTSKIGIDALFELTGTDRQARAYAFLYAAFRSTEVSKNPVRDAIDCLTPFISPYLGTIVGRQVDIQAAQTYLRTTFGFNIPLYAIEQLISLLANHGMVEWNRIAKAYIARSPDGGFNVAKSEIETDFDDVTEGLREYATEIGFPGQPPSGTWAEALISFLKTSTDRPGPRAVAVKGALIDPTKAQFAVVGSFIKRLHARTPHMFEKVLRIFMGVLVEEFISSVSELRLPEDKSDVVVLYDTGVLLRLLGTSGKMLRTATEELTRYLQDLGFEIRYFSGNESEVANIFDTIVFLKDTGKELEGETAEAISLGEVSITDVRMLQNAFPERLAALNVFPAQNLEASAQSNAKYQIDEKAFEAYLLHSANASNRAYGAQNREHDARFLGTVMRLRAGHKTRDLTQCRFLFVTTNKFLAQTARRYLIEQRVIQPQQCAPILSVGQVATIAWLMKDQKLVPEKAGRELLSNCFAAVRPDAEWLRYFREGIEKVTGSIEEFGKVPSNTLTLQAARRIAQEESFGSTALVRELNMAEILSRAEVERERLGSELQAELELVRTAAAREKDQLSAEIGERLAEAEQEAQRIRAEAAAGHVEALREAERQAAQLAESLVQEARLNVARRNARLLINLIRAVLVVAFVAVTGLALYLRTTGQNGAWLFIASAVLAVLSVLSFFNLLGVPLVRTWFDRLENRLTSALANV